jgi:hypothetical protein
MMRRRRPQRGRSAPNLPGQQPPETNPQLAAAVLEIVDTQLRERNPPETHQTLERLVAAGYSPEGARQMIAHVVVREIFTVMARGERYDAARFIAGLQRLPVLPEPESDA